MHFFEPVLAVAFAGSVAYLFDWLFYQSKLFGKD